MGIKIMDVLQKIGDIEWGGGPLSQGDRFYSSISLPTVIAKYRKIDEGTLERFYRAMESYKGAIGWDYLIVGRMSYFSDARYVAINGKIVQNTEDPSSSEIRKPIQGNKLCIQPRRLTEIKVGGVKPDEMSWEEYLSQTDPEFCRKANEDIKALADYINKQLFPDFDETSNVL
jgi:hypothetical protein